MSNYTVPSPTSAASAGPSSPPNGAGALAKSGPYPPQTAQLGLTPTTNVDTPICVILLLLFLGGAITHMVIFQINRKRGIKFVFSVLVFGFCMARILALAMRMGWASNPTNINVAIAANIFTAAGVLLLFIINLIFAQRILRAYHPNFGWNKGLGIAFRILFFTVVVVLIMVIAVTIQSFFTLNTGIRTTDRNIQLFSATYLSVIAFLPIPIVIIAELAPRPTRVEKFGQGSFHAKVNLLLFTATLLTLGAAFRAAVAYQVRPINDPAWFDGKAPYYCFNFVIELIVVYTYAISRFDRRFHVPNGSSGPGHYAGGEKRLTRTYYPGDAPQAHGLHTYRSAHAQSNFTLGSKRPLRNSTYTWVTDPKSDRESHYTHSFYGGSSIYGGATVGTSFISESDHATREQDREWMERAMQELYGEEQQHRR